MRNGLLCHQVSGQDGFCCSRTCGGIAAQILTQLRHTCQHNVHRQPVTNQAGGAGTNLGNIDAELICDLLADFEGVGNTRLTIAGIGVARVQHHS